MRISDYIKILRKSWYLMIIIIALFAGIAVFVTIRQKPTFQASAAVEITRFQNLRQQDVNYFQYDNYYNTQVAASLSDNIIGWLGAPSTVSEIFANAGYPQPEGTLTDIGKIFTVKKKVSTSSVLEISHSSADSQMSSQLVAKAVDVVRKKVESYNSADNAAAFKASTSLPVVVEAPKQTALNGIVAGIVGIFVALAIIFAREALRKEK
jgi:capsular polysaccharide biosynthesis protein